MLITQEMIDAQNKRLHDGLADVSKGIAALKADRAEAKHYAAALYAITSFCKNWGEGERADLADLVVKAQRERGLID